MIGFLTLLGKGVLNRFPCLVGVYGSNEDNGRGFYQPFVGLVCSILLVVTDRSIRVQCFSV